MTTTICWISIDPILGEPKTYTETDMIEQQFKNGAENIFLETFCRTIDFKKPFTQTTPSIGSKPRGIRSVVRCNLGEQITVYLCPNGRWYSTIPTNNSKQPINKQIIVQAAENIPETWQWCDKHYNYTKYALESNWHNFSEEISNQIEETYKHRGSITITIGLTNYILSNFEGSYGKQENSTTGMTRVIRRGISKFVSKKLEENLQDELCALCMEDFKDTLHIPRKTTLCNHTFHWTCLNNYKSRDHNPRCPMCRTDI